MVEPGISDLTTPGSSGAAAALQPAACTAVTRLQSPINGFQAAAGSAYLKA